MLAAVSRQFAKPGFALSGQASRLGIRVCSSLLEHTANVQLLIPAESISGVAFRPSFSIAELGAQRHQLDQGRFQPGEDGLNIEHPGKEGWNATGLAPRIAIAGDFDATLHLAVLHVEAAQIRGRVEVGTQPVPGIASLVIRRK